MEKKRLVAFKARVSEISGARFVKQDGEEPSHVVINGSSVSRVNVIGVVVSKDSNSAFESVVVDDGTGRISCRSFEKNDSFEKVNPGDFVLLVGKVREYGERYIAAEILRKLDDKRWLDLRKSEMKLRDLKTPPAAPTKNKFAERNPAVSEGVVEEELVEEANPKQKIFEFIRKLDKGNGAEVELILKELGSNDGERIIDSLLKTGDIFEVGPGRIKVLE